MTIPHESGSKDQGSSGCDVPQQRVDVRDEVARRNTVMDGPLIIGIGGIAAFLLGLPPGKTIGALLALFVVWAMYAFRRGMEGIANCPACGAGPAYNREFGARRVFPVRSIFCWSCGAHLRD